MRSALAGYLNSRGSVLGFILGLQYNLKIFRRARRFPILAG